MSRLAAALAACMLFALVPRPAHADDDKQDSLTVLPWSDATLGFSAGEKRAQVQYARTRDGGLAFSIRASAPLDEDTRTAAFTGENQLVSGFQGSLLVGWDSRAERLERLAAEAARIADAIEIIAAVPRSAASGLQDRFVTAHADVAAFAHGAGDSAIYRYFCKLARPDAACGLEDFDATLLDACTRHLGGTCADRSGFVATANAFWKARCSDLDDPHLPLDACTIADLGLYQLEKQAQERRVLPLLADPAVYRPMWRFYRMVLDVAGEKIPAGCGAAAQAAPCVAANARDIANRVRDFVRKEPLTRRDLLLTNVSDFHTWDVAALFGVSLAYDRAKVYQDDAASAPVAATAYDLQLGPDLTVYTPVEGLSASLRGGFERQRAVDARTFTRCAAVGSSSPMVSGQSCSSSALFRRGAAPDAESSGYLRAAVDYQYRTTPSKDALVPGVELRGGLDGLGATKSAGLRLTLFGTPVKGTSAARVGIAVELRYAIDRDPGSDDPRLTVTPLVFVGATFSDLMAP